MRGGTCREVIRMIFILGDNHGHFDKIIDTVVKLRPVAVISVGDIMGDKDIRPIDQELNEILTLTEFWWIPGNHDTDSEAAYDGLFGSTLAHRNFHGRVVTIQGVRFAGLGGVFREKIWMPPGKPQFQSKPDFLRHSPKASRWRGGIPLKHRSTIFPDVYSGLARGRADILITHEAPSCHPHGFQAIDALAQSLRVRATFHGHHHDSLDYSKAWADLGFKAHGVGLCGISDLEGTVIVAGEKDDARRYREHWNDPV